MEKIFAHRIVPRAALGRGASTRRERARARVDARGRDGRGRRGGVAASRALPPANEIAGFVVGAALVGLCVAGTRLDGIIARAQARGLEAGGRGARERRAANGGAVFVFPEDAEEAKANGGE